MSTTLIYTLLRLVSVVCYLNCFTSHFFTYQSFIILTQLYSVTISHVLSSISWLLTIHFFPFTKLFQIVNTMFLVKICYDLCNAICLVKNISNLKYNSNQAEGICSQVGEEPLFFEKWGNTLAKITRKEGNKNCIWVLNSGEMHDLKEIFAR